MLQSANYVRSTINLFRNRNYKQNFGLVIQSQIFFSQHWPLMNGETVEFTGHLNALRYVTQRIHELISTHYVICINNMYIAPSTVRRIRVMKHV